MFATIIPKRINAATGTGIGIAAAPAAPAAPAVPAAPALPKIPAGGSSSNMFGLSLNYPKWVPAGISIASYGTFISYTFYIFLAIFILFLILAVIHFTMFPVFSFSPNDDGLIPIPTVSDQQLAFTKSPAASDLSANFVSVPACTYTLGMDVYLSGNFMPTNLPRVLAYRSLRTAVSPPSSPDETQTIMSMFPDTNIVIWLDPMKNDLFVGAVTSSTGAAGNSSMETIAAIENVPMKKVFRVMVVFTRQFLEVYINGDLEKSLALKNLPISVSDNASFFPVISTIGPNVLISNMGFWPRPLSSREVRANGMPITNEAFYSKLAY